MQSRSYYERWLLHSYVSFSSVLVIGEQPAVVLSFPLLNLSLIDTDVLTVPYHFLYSYPTPVLFFFILLKERDNIFTRMAFSVHLQSFAYATSDHKYKIVALTACRNQNCKLVYVHRVPGQPTELAPCLRKIFHKISLGAISGTLPLRSLENEDYSVLNPSLLDLCPNLKLYKFQHTHTFHVKRINTS